MSIERLEILTIVVIAIAAFIALKWRFARRKMLRASELERRLQATGRRLPRGITADLESSIREESPRDRQRILSL